MKAVDLDLALCHTTQGTLQVRLLYHPVQRPEEKTEDHAVSEDLAALEEELATGSLWADADVHDKEEGKGEGEETSTGAVEGARGGQRGILTVEGLQLTGYTSKDTFWGGSKVFIRLALGTSIVRTVPERTPCQDPAFLDQFTFNIDDRVRGTSLDVTIIENRALGPAKFLGRASINLSTFTRRPGKTEADWPVYLKGKVVHVHIRAYFSPLMSQEAS
ncbi:plant [Nannochloropsis gaditana]|uniref:Plant n=1 Tax=Nannochloropsis gaditana TaxID=72520 RepID=W7TAZ6_9STRA|nr:plant [Nannochloropsis gaditana]